MSFSRLSALLAACLLLSAFLPGTATLADEFVKGYRKRNGTYVAPHMRSDRDGVFRNNWSTKGNINPYTGKFGTRVTPPGSNKRRPDPFDSYWRNRESSTASSSSYLPYSVPSVDQQQSDESERLAKLAAVAKAYSDAKLQWIAAAKASSDQRRKAFAAVLEAEKANLDVSFKAQEAEIAGAHERGESSLVESDKNELRGFYRELSEAFARKQALAARDFNASIAEDWHEFLRASDDRFFRARVFDSRNGDSFQTDTATKAVFQKREEVTSSIEGRLWAFESSLNLERQRFIGEAKTLVRSELKRRIALRKAALHRRVRGAKDEHDRMVALRISEMQSDFEQQEAKRFASDVERAEAQYLALVHAQSGFALDPKPVAAFHQTSASVTRSGNSIALMLILGTASFLAIGTFLYIRQAQRVTLKSPAKLNSNSWSGL